MFSTCTDQISTTATTSRSSESRVFFGSSNSCTDQISTATKPFAEFQPAKPVSIFCRLVSLGVKIRTPTVLTDRCSDWLYSGCRCSGRYRFQDWSILVYYRPRSMSICNWRRPSIHRQGGHCERENNRISDPIRRRRVATNWHVSLSCWPILNMMPF